tara:strand:+ start:666 stop:1439 length:774 start_codon:yes stop_codon:yes gene_type:complete
MSTNTPNLTNLKTIDRDGCIVPSTKEETELYLRDPKPSRTCAQFYEEDAGSFIVEDDDRWDRLNYKSQYNHLWLINRLGGFKPKQSLQDDRMHDHSDVKDVTSAVEKIYHYLNAHYMGAFEYEDGIWSKCIRKAKDAPNICQYSFKLNTGQWIEVVDWSDCGDLHVKRDIEYLYYSSMLYFYRHGTWLDQSKNDISSFARALNEAGSRISNKSSGLKGWINLRVGYAWFIRNYGGYIDYRDEHKWLTKILNQVRELK